MSKATAGRGNDERWKSAEERRRDKRWMGYDEQGKGKAGRRVAVA